MHFTRLFAPLLLTTVLGPTMAVAQFAGPTQYLELSPQDRARADAIMRDQAEKDAKAIAELKSWRDKLLRTSPLPPARNPLLGQWKVQARPRKAGELADAFDSLVHFEQAKCEALFGTDSITEFRAADWASIDSYGNDSLGSVQYRGDGKQVWMIPAQSISTGLLFMSLEFVSPNRVAVLTPTVDGDCFLNRVGAAAPTRATPGATPLTEKTAYQCPTGELMFVDACGYGQPGAPTCWTDRYDLPKVNDRVQVVMEKKAAVESRVRNCAAGGFQYKADGSPVFLPGAR